MDVWNGIGINDSFKGYSYEYKNQFMRNMSTIESVPHLLLMPNFGFIDFLLGFVFYLWVVFRFSLNETSFVQDERNFEILLYCTLTTCNGIFHTTNRKTVQWRTFKFVQNGHWLHNWTKALNLNFLDRKYRAQNMNLLVLITPNIKIFFTDVTTVRKCIISFAYTQTVWYILVD